MDKERILKILKDDSKIAIGCTEPVAVSLASAAAMKQVGGIIDSIEVIVDQNVYKNGMGVYVPGTGKKGLEIAAAVGALAGDHKKGLQVISGINKEVIKKAENLIESGKVKVTYITDKPHIYVETIITTSFGEGICKIERSHDNITYLCKKDVVIFEEKTKDEKLGNINNYIESISSLDMIKVIEIIDSLKEEELLFLEEGLNINLKIAEEGVNKSLGLGIGNKIKSMIKENKITNNIENQMKAYTAGACDARMAGANLPVMSCGSSGNQGLTATVPVGVAAKNLKASNEKLLKALAISRIITVYMKGFIGKLSAICGCAIAAATGTSAALVYLMGGDSKQIIIVIFSMTANLSGMICDGAKPGCALKLSTGVGAAYLTALLATEGITVPFGNGIVGEDVNSNMENIRRLSNPGMKSTNMTILQIMLDQFRV